jgi:EAL and modified HD-GYP domain-containing signal transduction protein
MRRARFCELLGELATGALPGRCFTAGILSTLDAFMDEELDTLVDSMSLSGELRAALLGRTGCMGAILDTALAFETASWERVPWRALAAHGIDQQGAERAYLDSLHWVSETLGGLEDGVLS